MAKKNKKQQLPDVRSPICTTLGHVDHGKSSVLDAIRGSNIISKEAGAITQAIGASIVPMSTIRKRCGDMLKAMNMAFTIPGLLFIDTPGHAAFTSLRKRGGTLADIAVLVVDMNEGFKPQTIEALEILKNSKTPFIIAANKLDLVPGFVDKGGPVLGNIQSQAPNVLTDIEMKLYEIVGKVSEFGFESERFDRVSDYTKQIAIVPTSAKTDIGVKELLMVLSGLAQKFLEKKLEFNLEGPAKGSILEVKEERGLGTTIDVILYDGNLNVNDVLVVGNINGPIVTKVKALLSPGDNCDIRDNKAKFCGIRQVVAATGVKISAPDLNNVISGMPIRTVGKDEDLEQVKEEIQAEVEEAIIETDGEGIVVKADCIGSLEALTLMLREKEIPVKRATIGNVAKKDIIEAGTSIESEPLHGVIIGFNIKSDIDSGDVKVITNEVIYQLVDDLEAWMEAKAASMQNEELNRLVRPAKLHLMNGYVFRQSNPAVLGTEVMEGSLTNNTPIMNIDGKEISRVKGIEADGKKVDKLERGSQAAVSLDGVTVGRQIKEGDILYSSIPEDDFIKLKEFKKELSNDEIETLKEIAEIKRRSNPVWGV